MAPKWFQDVDTGELIPADQFDSSQYDVVGDSAPNQTADPGVWDYVSAPFKKTASGLLDAYAGLSLGVSDFQKDHPLLSSAILPSQMDYMPPEATRAYGLQAKAKAKQISDNVDSALGLSEDSFGKRALDVAGSTVPSMAALFAGGPLLAAATGGLTAGSQKYSAIDELTNADGTPYATTDEKLLDAGTTGLLNAGFQYFPLKGIGNSTGNFLTRAAKETGKLGAWNLALSPAQTVVDATVDRATIGRPTSPEELNSRIKNNLINAELGSAMLGPVGAIGGNRGMARPVDESTGVFGIDSAMDALASQPKPVSGPLLLPAPESNPTTNVADSVQGVQQPLALPDPLYQNYNPGDGFAYRDFAALPPAVIEQGPVIDSGVEPLPQPFSLQVDPSQATNPLPPSVPLLDYQTSIIRPETYSQGRTRSKQKTRGEIASNARAEQSRLESKRLADEQFWAGIPEKSSQPDIPILKNQSEAVAFDNPMDRIAKAAQEAKTQEQPLIATEDNAPTTYAEIFRTVANKIAQGLKYGQNEGGFLNIAGGKPGAAPGGRKKVSAKEPSNNGRREEVYDKYSNKGPLAPRNLMFVDSIAKDVPEVAPIGQAIMGTGEHYASVLGQFENELMAMKAAQHDPKVREVIWKFEELGKNLPINGETLSKLGLNETQTRAVLASKQMSQKTSEVLAAHQKNLADRELAYTLKGLQQEAAGVQAKIKQKYDSQLAELRLNALDPTALGAAEQQIEQARQSEAVAVQDKFTAREKAAYQQRGAAIKAIDNRSAAWADSNYVPRSRNGEYQLAIYHPDGEVEVRQTPSKKELAQWQKAYEAQGIKVAARRLMNREQTEHFNGISKEVSDSMDPIRGFNARLARSKRVRGADTDFVRAQADYAMGLAKKISLEQMEMAIKEGIQNAPRDPRDATQVDVAFSPVVNELIKRKESLLQSRSGWWPFVSKLADLNFIAGQARAPIGNIFAIPQRQYPELGKYTSNPLFKITKSVFKNIDRMRMSDGDFAKKYPDLASGIEAYLSKQSSRLPKAEGLSWWQTNRASFSKQVGRMAKEGRGSNDSILSHADDAVFFLQAHSDRFAEANGFITGWDVYPDAVKTLKQKGEPIPSRQEFAERFANDTKANVPSEYMPSWGHGASRATYAKYKAWQMRYLGALKQAAGEKNWPFIARTLGASLASGGLRALPFYKMTTLALQSLGINPEDELNKYFSDTTASAAVYGPVSTATGVNISGSVGFGDPIPDLSQGVEAMIGSLVGGTVTGLAKKGVEAGKYALAGEYRRALEELPAGIPGLSNILKADRIGKEGVITKSGLGVVPKNQVTPGMQALQALGLQSMKTARAYDKIGAMARAANEGRDWMGLPALIAKHEIRGEYDIASSLREDARAAGIKDIEKKVREKKKTMSGDRAAILKRYPKNSRGAAKEAARWFGD